MYNLLRYSKKGMWKSAECFAGWMQRWKRDNLRSEVRMSQSAIKKEPIRGTLDAKSALASLYWENKSESEVKIRDHNKTPSKLNTTINRYDYQIEAKLLLKKNSLLSNEGNVVMKKKRNWICRKKMTCHYVIVQKNWCDFLYIWFYEIISDFYFIEKSVKLLLQLSFYFRRFPIGN